MGNLIVSITIFLSIMLCSTTSVASCADSPYLASIKSSDESFYNVNLFSICAQKKECSIANESLLKLKNSDQVAFSFVKGVSLANGDCTKQDVGGALRNLKYCSRYSIFCKANLILLCQNMSLYDEEYFKIAVSAADSGHYIFLSYLAAYFYEKGGERGYVLSYYWGSLLLRRIEYGLKHELVKNGKTINNAYYDIINNYAKDIEKILVDTSKKFNPRYIPQINRISSEAFELIARPSKFKDGLEEEAKIYGVNTNSVLNGGNFSGVNAIPVQQKNRQKINEGRQDIDMERYQRLVEALLG